MGLRVRGGSAALAEAASRVGLVPLLLPAVPKRAKEWLSFSAWWVLLSGGGKMDLDLLPRSLSLLDATLQIVSVAVLYCSPSPDLKAALRSFSSAWTSFVIQGSMFRKTLMHFLMHIDDCLRTSAHTSSHISTHKTTHKDWESTELLHPCAPPCWTEEREYRIHIHKPKCSCHLDMFEWVPSLPFLLGGLEDHLKSLNKHRECIVHLGCCWVTSLISEIHHFIIQAQEEHWTLWKKTSLLQEGRGSWFKYTTGGADQHVPAWT